MIRSKRTQKPVPAEECDEFIELADLDEDGVYFDDENNGPYYHEDWIMQGSSSNEDRANIED